MAPSPAQSWEVRTGATVGMHLSIDPELEWCCPQKLWAGSGAKHLASSFLDTPGGQSLQSVWGAVLITVWLQRWEELLFYWTERSSHTLEFWTSRKFVVCLPLQLKRAPLCRKLTCAGPLQYRTRGQSERGLRFPVPLSPLSTHFLVYPSQDGPHRTFWFLRDLCPSI